MTHIEKPSNLSPENEKHRAVQRLRSPRVVLVARNEGTYHNTDRASRRTKRERQALALLRNQPKDALAKPVMPALPKKVRPPAVKWRMTQPVAYADEYLRLIGSGTNLSHVRCLDVVKQRAVPFVIARKVTRAFGAEVPALFEQVKAVR